MKKVLLSILAFVALNYSLKAQTVSLFDGKTTTGWHSYNKTGPGAWSVVNGAIQLDPKAPNQGDLITDREYQDYELTLEWKLPKAAIAELFLAYMRTQPLTKLTLPVWRCKY